MNLCSFDVNLHDELPMVDGNILQDQMHVVDHTAGTEMQETRNVLKESARIARGKISPLAKLAAGDFDAVILPGKSDFQFLFDRIEICALSVCMEK